MMKDPRATRHEDLAGRVRRVLGLGITTSSVCFAIGLGMTLGDLGVELASVLLRTALGILLVTPAARVIVSMVGFARDRDWLFVVLTLIVLGELVGSVFAAFVGVA